MKFSPFFSCAQPVRLSRRRLKGTWLRARKFVEAIFSTLPVAHAGAAKLSAKEVSAL
jgi:hypothetical protein